MKEVDLFRSNNGTWISNLHLLEALEKVGAPQCKVLYIHTGMSFGIPNPALTRQELLASLYELIKALGVETICLPTFTFSFCNGVHFDVLKSRSHMGALNEYIRQLPEAVRSVDPLMSVTLVGKEVELVINLGHESIGKDSTFDKLSRLEDVQFLFFGVRVGDCFTYMHYLEWLAKVPYRYNREFKGRIKDADKDYEDSYTLFVRYKEVKPNAASYEYENLLQQNNLLRVQTVGDSFIRCIREQDARSLYLELLQKNMNYFIETPFSPSLADKHFEAHNMTAL